MELRARADELSADLAEMTEKINPEDGEQIDFKDAETWQEYHKKMKSAKVWDFSTKQPNWVLLPKPDYVEQSREGLNLQIGPNQTVSLSNNKEAWDSKNYKNLLIECSIIFEKVDVEVSMINEQGTKIIISQQLRLKEGTASLNLTENKDFNGKIKELQLSIKNTHTRNNSNFNIKKILLTN